MRITLRYLRPPNSFRRHPIGLAAFLTTALAAGILFTSFAQVETGLTSIREKELQEKLTYFASREFNGRGNGTEDLNKAADYIAEGFRRSGLVPLGAGGGYFQYFTMFRSELGPDNRLSLRRGAAAQNLSLSRDYVPHHLSPSGTFEGQMVFVGFGVAAPHLKFDEFAGVDLRGKVAVALEGHPRMEDPASPFNRIHISDFSVAGVKAQRAKDAGAVALILIQNSRIPNSPRIGQMAEMFQESYPLRFVPMGAIADPDNPPIPVVIVSEDAGRRLVPRLQELQREIDQALQPRSAALTQNIAASVNVIRRQYRTQNVVGLIEGSDPRLRNEVVVVGAHYDHDGVYNGQVWFGADDNASGTVALIELAEAFGPGSSRPARSIILAAWAGEEKGLLGSRYYAAHPARPLNATVAMLQLDMIGRNEEHPANRRLGLERERASDNVNMLNLIGGSFSPDLRSVIEKANGQTGLLLRFRYDDTPEELLRRSDQWPFLKRGVPAIFFHTGEHPDYHTPRDTPDKINYAKLTRVTQLVYVTAVDLAGNPGRPRFSAP